MSKSARKVKCFDRGFWASMAVAFGVGLTFSCFCPQGVVLLIAAIIITSLGVAVLKC